MKRSGMSYKCLFILVVLLLFAMGSWAADEGAALYRKRCGSCHGSNGEGNPSMRAPAVKGTTLDADQLVQLLTKGESRSRAPHNRGMSRLNEEQAKAIADYIKTL